MRPDMILVSSKSKHVMAVCNFLHRSNINVYCVDNAYEAKAKYTLHNPAFLLLDIDISSSSSLLSEISSGSVDNEPYIIIASAFSNGNERAAMYRQGADICIQTPICVEEVLAIIQAVLRRRQKNPQLFYNKKISCVEFKDLIIDFTHRKVTMRGIQIALTRKEYDVLSVLANHAGIVMTKEEIHTAVWRTNYDPKATNISDQISSLRRKLGLTSKDKNYIQTVVGVGYRFGAFM